MHDFGTCSFTIAEWVQTTGVLVTPLVICLTTIAEFPAVVVHVEANQLPSVFSMVVYPAEHNIVMVRALKPGKVEVAHVALVLVKFVIIILIAVVVAVVVGVLRKSICCRRPQGGGHCQ